MAIAKRKRTGGKPSARRPARPSELSTWAKVGVAVLIGAGVLGLAAGTILAKSATLDPSSQFDERPDGSVGPTGLDDNSGGDYAIGGVVLIAAGVALYFLAPAKRRKG